MSEQYSPSEHLTEDLVLELAEQQSGHRSASADSTTPAARHLQRCDSCYAWVSDTARVISALRPATSDDDLVEETADLADPPPGLWAVIAAETAQTRTETQQPPAPVTDLATRRGSRRTWLWVGGAAAAGLAVGAALATAVLGQPKIPGEPEPLLAGEAQLAPVSQANFTGEAEMFRHADGQLTLTVQVAEVPAPEDGYLELWLRDEQASRLISLGTVTTTSTTVTVPQGMDLSEYPVVDVSHEHYDGDPSHSGVTLAAGPMEPADS